MMLGPVVCPVGGARAPEESELALGLAASQPVESHVHGLCVLGLYIVVYDSTGCAVVGWGSLWLISASIWHCGAASRALM